MIENNYCMQKSSGQKLDSNHWRRIILKGIRTIEEEEEMCCVSIFTQDDVSRKLAWILETRVLEIKGSRLIDSKS